MSLRRSVPGVDFAQVREDLGIAEQFPPEVVAEAEQVAAAGMPAGEYDDATDIPFVTLDPDGSRDLDQAVHIARDGDGYVVHYAIADVAAFVQPGGAIDTEAWKRGQTLYCPDVRIPLHPTQLSEGAASLLPDGERPAALWRFRLDKDGVVQESGVRRARVRSIAQLTYEQTQRDFESGTPHESLALLQEVGERRLALAADRGSINLNLPEQVVEAGPDGSWTLSYRDQLPCELWNAEISLMTGMAAGQLMVDGGIGILRTLPVPEQEAIDELRTTARALGIDWPDGATPAQVIDALDRRNPRHVAFIEQTPSLLRGAGYFGFTSGNPKDKVHSGIAAVYAHVTAPLRRLVDRYGTEVCLALSAGTPVPEWAASRLEELPDVMRETGQVERKLEATIIDTVEALLLAPRVGQRFEAQVVGRGDNDVTVVLSDPAVRARASGQAELGATVQVELRAADPAEHKVELAVL